MALELPLIMKVSKQLLNSFQIFTHSSSSGLHALLLFTCSIATVYDASSNFIPYPPPHFLSHHHAYANLFSTVLPGSSFDKNQIHQMSSSYLKCTLREEVCKPNLIYHSGF